MPQADIKEMIASTLQSRTQQMAENVMRNNALLKKLGSMPRTYRKPPLLRRLKWAIGNILLAAANSLGVYNEGEY